MDRSESLRASPPMFKSGLLDKFTRVHHLVPVVIFLPAIAILAGYGVARVGLGPAGGVGGGRLPVVDAGRVLDPPRDLPLRARGGDRRAAALDGPRRPPRPS